MTVTEFSREFDLLYNNIMSNMAPGLDAYEKSVFLTMAQEEVVRQLYAGTLGDGFESSELNRRYLDKLITKVTVDSSNPSFPTVENGGLVFENGIRKYTFPLDDSANPVFTIIAEQTECTGVGCCNDTQAVKTLNVQPVKYDDLNRVLNNPFRRPNRNQALRLDTGELSSQRTVCILTTYPINSYSYEYLKKPNPIIVEPLQDGSGNQYSDSLGLMSVDGRYNVSECELDPALHRIILKHAVQLAAASWASNNKS